MIMKQPAIILFLDMSRCVFDRCYEKSLLTFGYVADAVSIVVILLVLIATFNGLFRIMRSGSRRTILLSLIHI